MVLSDGKGTVPGSLSLAIIERMVWDKYFVHSNLIPSNQNSARKQNSLVADMEKVLVNQTIHNVPLSESLMQSTALTLQLYEG